MDPLLAIVTRFCYHQLTISLLHAGSVMSQEFSVHKIQWSPDAVRRFWDRVSSLESYQTKNFGSLAGEWLLRFIGRHGIRPAGAILDFGCGTGGFLEILLRRGIPCEGAELSPAAAEIAERTLSRYPGFGGVRIVEAAPFPYGDSAFNLVFATEALEHLIQSEAIMAELFRITRPGGTIVLTTPNDENLETGRTMCPDCGCVFHRGQHVSSWRKESLVALMEKAGYNTVVCIARTIRGRGAGNLARSIAEEIIPGRKKLNLMYIGKKR